MAFQEGVGGLMSFHNALAATHAGNWQLAHDQFLASKWGRQTPARANREAQRILTGINNVPEKYDS
jgi:lysozyme